MSTKNKQSRRGQYTARQERVMQKKMTKGPHEKVKTVAIILSASNDGVSRISLSKKLDLRPDLVSEYAEYLKDNGLLTKETRNDLGGEPVYQRTKLGGKLLGIFVNLHRMVGERTNKSAKAEIGERTYMECGNCEPHPSFPGRHPITLHEGNVCLVCQKAAVPKTSTLRT